ncbi:hypothetical protein XENTR_v10003906 [Xenopus tropicalis]|nr:hypothetical protein XENTR_v10003906 [Xenopus tropicalis]
MMGVSLMPEHYGYLLKKNINVIFTFNFPDSLFYFCAEYEYFQGSFPTSLHRILYTRTLQAERILSRFFSPVGFFQTQRCPGRHRFQEMDKKPDFCGTCADV